MKKFVATLIILVLSVLAVLAMLITITHASTTKALPNSLGVPEYTYNPNTYLLALPREGQQLEGGYNIRFWPFGTPELYDESVLFCSIEDKFEGKTGVLIVVYETRAHRVYQGIGCHELRGVFEVKP